MDPSFSHQIKDYIPAAEQRRVLGVAGERAGNGNRGRILVSEKRSQKAEPTLLSLEGAAWVSWALLPTAHHLSLSDVS